MKRKMGIKIDFLGSGDKRLRSVEFIVDPDMPQSFLPLELVTSANIPIGDFSLRKPDGKTTKLNAVTKNLLCTTRDVTNVIIRDFLFAASDEYGAILGADFLSLFTYRITDDKVYLVCPR